MERGIRPVIVKTEEDLRRHLKQGELCRLYLVCCPDPELKNRCVRGIVRVVCGSADETFNLQRFEGDTVDLRQLAAAVEALPFLAERKCVCVDNLDYAALDKGQKDGFKELVSDLPPTTVLILNMAPGFGSSADKKTKEREAPIRKLADKFGCCAELGPRTPAKRKEELQRLAKARGCTIGSRELDWLLQNCPGDVSTLEGEMEKLTAYVGAGEITMEHLRLLAIQAVDARVFDLAKRIQSGDYAEAMRTLDELLFQRQEPTAILSVLSGAYLDLYRAFLGAGSGVSREEILRDFSYPPSLSFRVENALRDSRRCQLPQLRAAVELLGQGEYRLKSQKSDPRTVLQQIITELFLLGSRQGGC